MDEDLDIQEAAVKRTLEVIVGPDAEGIRTLLQLQLTNIAELRAARRTFDIWHFESFKRGGCKLCGHTWWGNTDDSHKPDCPMVPYHVFKSGECVVFTPEMAIKRGWDKDKEAFAKLQAAYEKYQANK